MKQKNGQVHVLYVTTLYVTLSQYMCVFMSHCVHVCVTAVITCLHYIGLPEVKKQFYIEDPAVSRLTPDEVQQIRFASYTYTCICIYLRFFIAIE